MGGLARSPSGVSHGEVIAIAGRSDLQYVAAEIIERNGDAISRRSMSAAIYLPSSPDSDLKPVLDRLCRPRPPLAGLPADRPLIMGIVNVTPDSFSDGGRYLAPDAAVAHALGSWRRAPIFSTSAASRPGPGSDGVDLDEEFRRVLPVIEALARDGRAALHRHAQGGGHAARSLEGVHIINDVSALTHDAEAAEMPRRNRPARRADACAG